ncbi:MAG: ABC transporter substrate-binding protein [Treponema sp.]|nr:ABC transporter substrate-binding protein [Treponema sp.]
MYIFANDENYRNGDMAVEEFEKRTAKTLNIDLNIHVIPRQVYAERLVLLANTSTEADLVFDAPWMNITSLVQENAYKELSGYFESPGLEGLRAAFPPSFLDSNRFHGGIYGIPIMDAPMDIQGVYYRKDLADKYGLVIETYNDLRAFFETVLRQENDMAPMVIQNNRGFYFMFDSPLEMGLKGLYPIEGIIGGVRELFWAGVSQDGKRITGVSAYGDPPDSYVNYKAPYNTFEGFNKYFLEAAKWNKYVPRDSVMREMPQPLFLNGYAAAGEGTISEFSRIQINLKNRAPHAELGFWPYIDAIRNREKGLIHLSFRAWNYLCIPRNSTKTEKVFEFLNWVFESQENNDLFSYGIRGVHWDREDDDSLPVLILDTPGEERYQFPGYELTWNPRFVRIPENLPEDIRALLEYQYAPDSFRRIPISGFVFDNQAVITELTQIRAIFMKYHKALLCGAYDDPSAVLRKMNGEMEAAGLRKVKNEIARQVQGHLDAGRQ